MKSKIGIFLCVMICLLLPNTGKGQHIFSENPLDYSKFFQPYDIPYIIPMEGKQFVMLAEHKKNVLLMGRYDEYLFEKWERLRLCLSLQAL